MRTIVFLTIATAWSTAAAEPPDLLAWRLEAEPIGTSATEFRNVRLVSATTYVRADYAKIEGIRLNASRATVFADGWRLAAEELSVDLRLDEVEITTLRTDAPAE